MLLSAEVGPDHSRRSSPWLPKRSVTSSQLGAAPEHWLDRQVSRRASPLKLAPLPQLFRPVSDLPSAGTALRRVVSVGLDFDHSDEHTPCAGPPAVSRSAGAKLANGV